MASHSCKIIGNTDKSLKILRHDNHDVVELFSKLGIRFHIPTRLRSIDVDAVMFLAIFVSSFSSSFYFLFLGLLLFLIFYSFFKLLDIFTLFLIDGYKPFFLQELSHLLQRFLLVFPTTVKHTKYFKGSTTEIHQLIHVKLNIPKCIFHILFVQNQFLKRSLTAMTGKISEK